MVNFIFYGSFFSRVAINRGALMVSFRYKFFTHSRGTAYIVHDFDTLVFVGKTTTNQSFVREH